MKVLLVNPNFPILIGAFVMRCPLSVSGAPFRRLGY